MTTNGVDPGRLSPNIRVAVLTDGLFPFVLGGMQRHSRALAEYMQVAGANVTVFHTAGPTGDDQAARTLAGLPTVIWDRIATHYIPYPTPGRFPGHYVPDCRNYSRLLLEAFLASDTNVDFIYAQGLTGISFLEAKRRGARLPPIGVNAHGYQMFQQAASPIGQIEYALLRPIFRRMSREADIVFTFSRKVRQIVEDVLNVAPDRIVEIPNGIDPTWIRASITQSSARRKFVFVGRYNRMKGIPVLYSAIKQLPPSNLEFHFAGPFPLRHQLARPNVFYHGTVTSAGELQAILDEADVLLCPSVAEGMPTVILEAMARGLAVIATDVGASGELVDDLNGVLLPRSSPRLVSSAIARIASLPSLALDRLKQESLKRGQRYAWPQIVEQTLHAISRHVSTDELSGRTHAAGEG